MPGGSKSSNTNATNIDTGMAKSDDTTEESDDDEMLPDEREAVAERLERLDDEDRRSLSEVREALETDE
jgi:hypothetical protein